MKRQFGKQGGFTLIELLVVIVIMGILATISTATFSSYFAKARDAKRLSAVQNMKMLIQVDNADNWDPDRYRYELQALKDLFSENDFKLPKSEANYCYFIGFGGGLNSNIGDDNQFYVATYLEDPGEVLVEGTNDVKDVLSDGENKAIASDIYCNAGTLYAKATPAFDVDSALGGDNEAGIFDLKFIINTDGEITPVGGS